MKFAMKAKLREDGVILFLFGKFDFSVKEEFFHEMKTHELNQRQVFIDLENVSFIDSAGIGILASFAKRCKKLNNRVDLKIVNPQGPVRDVLKLTNFSGLVPVVDSDSEYSTFTNINT
ncbi:MAG: STAS domain-containing protein [Nitrospirales bacterium]